MTTCLNCNKEFDGRRNQKFCGLKCKNKYHNEANREKNAVVHDLNKVLHRNWMVLRNLYEVYKSSPIKMEMLTQSGYHPSYHTHTFNAPSGDKYTMVYDLGWRNHLDNTVQIVLGDSINYPLTSLR